MGGGRWQRGLKTRGRIAPFVGICDEFFTGERGGKSCFLCELQDPPRPLSLLLDDQPRSVMTAA
jgi:hypothetical protein